MQITTTYKIHTKYYENMRSNKYKDSPKTNLGEPSRWSNSFFLKRHSLSISLESFSSSSWTNMGLKCSLSHELFSEKKPYIQLKTKFNDRASCI